MKYTNNFYLQDDNGKVFEVDFDIDQYPDAKSIIDNEFKNVCFLKPIPITEDWLVRFGFEKVRIDYTLTHCYHYQNEYCWIYLIRGGFEFELIVGKERFNLMRTYEYIHQLQNLYFALTGKELILKE